MVLIRQIKTSVFPTEVFIFSRVRTKITFVFNITNTGMHTKTFIYQRIKAIVKVFCGKNKTAV